MESAVTTLAIAPCKERNAQLAELIRTRPLEELEEVFRDFEEQDRIIDRKERLSALTRWVVRSIETLTKEAT